MSVKRGKKPTHLEWLIILVVENYKPAFAGRVALPVLAAVVDRELVEAC